MCRALHDALAWPDVALARFAFNKILDDDFSDQAVKMINQYLRADSADDFRESAGKLKDVLDKMKDSASIPGYKPDKNDLIDSEQLVYLSDPSLHFITGDGGYLKRIERSVKRRGYTKRLCPS